MLVPHQATFAAACSYSEFILFLFLNTRKSLLLTQEAFSKGQNGPMSKGRIFGENLVRSYQLNSVSRTGRGRVW